MGLDTIHFHFDKKILQINLLSTVSASCSFLLFNSQKTEPKKKLSFLGICEKGKRKPL